MTWSFSTPLMCSFFVVRPSTRPQSSTDERLDEPSLPWTSEGISWYINPYHPISIFSMRFIEIPDMIPDPRWKVSHKTRPWHNFWSWNSPRLSGAQPFPLKLDLQFCHEPRRDSLPEARQGSTKWFPWFEASLTFDFQCNVSRMML